MKDGNYGMSGWKEFQRNRQNILDEVERIKQLTLNRPVRVAHGNAAEAQIRKWLSEFLPRKYGVTSGFIVPDLYLDHGGFYHFDIIIYDALQAPILWVEGNADDSEQGKSRAIPAKYVKAVYEVKSTLSPKTVSDATEKLSELSVHTSRLDKDFSCGVIFVELPPDEVKNQQLLKRFIPYSHIPGFWGGVVLYCKVDGSATGEIRFFNSDKTPVEFFDNESPLAIPIDDVKILYRPDGSVQLAGTDSYGGAATFTSLDGKWCVTKMYSKIYALDDFGVSLNWSRSGFSDFAMTMLSKLDGLKEADGKGALFAKVFDSLDPELVPHQESDYIEGAPHVILGAEVNRDSSNFLDISECDGVYRAEFTLTAHNTGGAPAELGENNFTDIFNLEIGKIARFRPNPELHPKNSSKKSISEFNKLIDELSLGLRPIEFTKKIIYRFKDSVGESRFRCVHVRFSIFRDRYDCKIVSPHTS